MAGKFDFCGWVTRNDTRCSDGRIIKENAFQHDDGVVVPLVWNHQHTDASGIIGKVLLENRPEGVYGYGSFNNTSGGVDAAEAVRHGDITSMSIYANQLKQNGSNVIHGCIREVSLVLAGANPGAKIENVAFAHSYDGELNEEEAIITYYLPFELTHSADHDEVDFDDDEEEDDEFIDDEDEEFEHSYEEIDDEDQEDNEEFDDDEEDEEYDEEDEEYDEEDDELEHSDESEDISVGEVLDSLSDIQQQAVSIAIAAAIEAANDEDNKGEEEMKHNLFDEELNNDNALQHAEFEAAVIGDMKKCGSAKEAFLAHADEYGITNIDWLQPEFQNINGNGAPGFIKRTPDAWVDTVMSGVHHSPFAKIKMMFADLREDEARAKGYIKGKLKKEEVFGLLKRQVGPTTIYKKQKLDRDDVIDITDFDVISWLKSEMRMMLDEELARAIVFGDGRPAMSDDKINETNIIPIWKDAPLYTITKTVTPASGETLGHAIINASVKAQDEYEGSGNLTCFVAASTVSDMLLLEDKDGHRLYKDMRDLALAMSVERIVKVPASIIPTGLLAVIVDLKDYNVGADKGGAINMFDDFDIDYNQMKYLIETRCSGALVKPFSAIALKTADAAQG